MLSNQIDEKLEPLRVTLGLTGKDFREGVFSWRGFLYYKWSMDKFWPDVMNVLREINKIQPHRRRDARPDRPIWPPPRRNIIEMVRDNGNHVNKVLAIYDASFQDLVAEPDAQDLPRLPAVRAATCSWSWAKSWAPSPILSASGATASRRTCPQTSTPRNCPLIFHDFCSGFGERIQNDDP